MTKDEPPADFAFAQRFLKIAKTLLAEAGLGDQASAENHPRHEEYVALIKRAWKEASDRH
jgi:hypothetical protein